MHTLPNHKELQRLIILWTQTLILGYGSAHHKMCLFYQKKKKKNITNTVKLHILEWYFTMGTLRHTCVIVMLSDQDLDMPHQWRMDYLRRAHKQI